MIEIVFGESACGSLKIAQTYGKGKYRGSAVSVFMRHEDGSVPSSDEMKQLRPLNCQTTIYLVKLPAWEYGKENTMTSKIAWGEVSPGEWGKYITLQEKAKPVFLSACAMKWNQLQNENAPLRAMLNGKLQSVSEDIYDSFILREIAEQPEQFKMAIVIGNVLGKYQLGISDVWISNRIDKMLEDGVLEIIQDAPKGETNYRRILRKRMK